MSNIWKECEEDSPLKHMKDNKSSYKTIEIKQDIMMKTKIINELEKKKEKYISYLQELLKKLEQLNYLKETEGIDNYTMDSQVKERLLSKLNFRTRELQTTKSVLKQYKVKYEMSLLNSDSAGSKENLEDLTIQNAELKVKVKELKIKQNLNMKEIENLQHNNYYNNIIASHQGEIKQLAFKKNDYLVKISKSEKSITIMKGIFLSVLEESSKIMSSNRTNDSSDKIQNLIAAFSNSKIEIDEGIQLLTTLNPDDEGTAIKGKEELDIKRSSQSPTVVGRTRIAGSIERKKEYDIGSKSKPNSRARLPPLTKDSNSQLKKDGTASSHKTRIKPINTHSNLQASRSSYNLQSEEANIALDKELQVGNEAHDFATCDNNNYEELKTSISNLKEIKSQINHAIDLYGKVSKKKIADAIKRKEILSHSLETIKDENDLIKKEIEYLNQQLELSKSKDKNSSSK